jgi:hypothetical protein
VQPLTLDSQTLAALGATSIDDGAATTGLHADQKAMGAGATGFGGLISAFHDSSSLALRFSGRATRPTTWRNRRLSQTFRAAANQLFEKIGISLTPSHENWFMIRLQLPKTPVDKFLITFIVGGK